MISLLLAIVGMAEAVVYQGRYRATHGSPLAAGAWTLAVCLLRVAFVCLGVSAALKDQWAAALVAYAVPAAAVTAWVRAGERRRERLAFDCAIRPGDALIVSGHTSNEARINGVWRKP